MLISQQNSASCLKKKDLVTNRNCNGTTTEVMESVNSLFTEDATVIRTDSLIAKSAKVDAVTRKMFASFLEWSVLVADPSVNGTTIRDRTAVTNSTTADVKATPIVSITLKSVKIGARKSNLPQPQRPKLRTDHIRNRIVKMNDDRNQSVNVNRIVPMEVFYISFRQIYFQVLFLF